MKRMITQEHRLFGRGQILDRRQLLNENYAVICVMVTLLTKVFHGALEYMMRFTNGMDDAGSDSGDDSSYTMKKMKNAKRGGGPNHTGG